MAYTRIGQQLLDGHLEKLERKFIAINSIQIKIIIYIIHFQME